MERDAELNKKSGLSIIKCPPRDGSQRAAEHITDKCAGIPSDTE